MVTATVVVRAVVRVVAVVAKDAAVLKQAPFAVTVAPNGILGALREYRRVGSSRNRRIHQKAVARWVAGRHSRTELIVVVCTCEY